MTGQQNPWAARLTMAAIVVLWACLITGLWYAWAWYTALAIWGAGLALLCARSRKRRAP